MEDEDKFYDDKFKEMQKFVPFLNDIITKIESSSGKNIESLRGIQSSKIKSLRQLLCGTEKRMKLENLLKCEEILKKIKDKLGRNYPDKLKPVLAQNSEKVDKPTTSKEEISVSKAESSVDRRSAKNTDKNTDSKVVKPSEEYLPKSHEKVTKEKLETGHNSGKQTESEFQASLKKFKELTEKSRTKESEQAATKYAKEIELVTKAYMNDKGKIELSQIMNKTIPKEKEKINAENELKNKDAVKDSHFVGKSKIHSESPSSSTRQSNDRTPHSPIRFDKKRSESSRHPKDFHRSEGRSSRERFYSRRSPDNSRFKRDFREKRPPRESRSGSSHSGSPHRLNRDRRDRYHSKVSRCSSSEESDETAEFINKISSTVESKRKKNKSAINKLLENNVKSSEITSISVLKKLRKKLKKEIRLEKTLEQLVETVNNEVAAENEKKTIENKNIDDVKDEKIVPQESSQPDLREILNSKRVEIKTKKEDDTKDVMVAEKIEPIVMKTEKDVNFEQDVLDALKSEISSDFNVDMFTTEIEKQVDNDTSPKKTTNINDNPKTRRISLEKYKEKISNPYASSESEGFVIDEQEKFEDHVPIQFKDYYKTEQVENPVIADQDEHADYTASPNEPIVAVSSVGKLIESTFVKINSPKTCIGQSQMVQPPKVSPKINIVSISETNVGSPKFEKENKIASEEKHTVPKPMISPTCGTTKCVPSVNRHNENLTNQLSSPHVGNIQKINRPPQKDRLNLDFPVSANYKGKNPRPMSWYGSCITSKINVNTGDTVSTHRTEHFCKGVYFDDDDTDLNSEDSLHSNRGNFNFKNITSIESQKELSLHKSSKSSISEVKTFESDNANIIHDSKSNIQKSTDPRLIRDPRLNRRDSNTPTTSKDLQKMRLEQMVEKKMLKEEDKRCMSDQTSSKQSDSKVTLTYKIPRKKKESENDGDSIVDKSEKPQTSANEKKEINQSSKKVHNEKPSKNIVILDYNDTYVVYDELDEDDDDLEILEENPLNEKNPNSKESLVNDVIEIGSDVEDCELQKIDPVNKADITLSPIKEVEETITDCVTQDENLTSEEKPQTLEKTPTIEKDDTKSSTNIPEKIDEPSVDNKIEDIPSTDKLENVQQPSASNITAEKKDPVSSILDVLKNKEMVIELLKNEESLPPKLKKRLELLINIDSDDETEEKPTEEKPAEIKPTEEKTTEAKPIEKEPIEEKPTEENTPPECPEIIKRGGKKKNSKSKSKTVTTNKDVENDTVQKVVKKKKSRAKNEIDILRESLPEVYVREGGVADVGIRSCRARQLVYDPPSPPREAEEVKTKRKRSIDSEESSEDEFIITKKKKSSYEVPKTKDLIILVEKCTIEQDKEEDDVVEAEEIEDTVVTEENLDELEKFMKPCPISQRAKMIKSAKKMLEKEKLASKAEQRRKPIKACPLSKKPQEKLVSKDEPSPKRSKPCPLSKKPNLLSSTKSEIIEEKPVIKNKACPKSVKLRRQKNAGTLIVDDISNIEKCDTEPVVSEGSHNQNQKSPSPITKVTPKKLSKNSCSKWSVVSKTNATKEIIPKVLNADDYKNFHFIANITEYLCKYCNKFRGKFIVKHILEKHPEIEVLISRLSPKESNQAIIDAKTELNSEQDGPDTNLLVSRLNEYTCRFCHRKFRNMSLTTFYYHVGESHTGEYQNNELPKLEELDSENVDSNVLYGYICSKCNYTQILKKNVDRHVANMHSDEAVEIFRISLCKPLPDIFKKITLPVESEDKSETSLDTSVEIVTPIVEKDIAVPICDDGVFSTSMKTTELTKELNFETVNSISELNIKEEEIGFTVDDFSQDFLDVSSTENLLEISIKNEVIPIPEEIDDDVTEVEVVDPAPNAEDYDVTVGAISLRAKSGEASKYYCHINNCTFITNYFVMFAVHLEKMHNGDTVDGLCSVCHRISDEDMPVIADVAFQHILQFHNIQNSKGSTKITNEKRNEAAAKTSPVKISVRPISDLLATPILSQYLEKPAKSVQPRIESVISLNPNNVNVRVSNDDMENDLFESLDSVIKTRDTTEDVVTASEIFNSTEIEQPKNVDLFVCTSPECSMTTNNCPEFFNHLREHSTNVDSNGGVETWKKCVYCMKTEENVLALLHHITKEHGHCRYKCTDCHFRAFTHLIALVHSKFAHPKSKNRQRVEEVVPYQNKPFTTEVNKLDKASCFLPFICKIVVNSRTCNKEFFDPTNFLQHLSMNHKNQSAPCHVCDADDMEPIKLIKHLRENHNFNLFKCAYCEMGDDKRLTMLHHLMEQHPNHSPLIYMCCNSKGPQAFNSVIEIDLSVNADNMLTNVFLWNGIQEESDCDCISAAEHILNTKYSKESMLHKSIQEDKNISNLDANVTNVDKCDKLSDIIVVESDEEATLVSESDDEAKNSDDMFYEEENVSKISNDEKTSSADKSGHTRKHHLISGLSGAALYICEKCRSSFQTCSMFRRHVKICYKDEGEGISCCHCQREFKKTRYLFKHYLIHGEYRFKCGLCDKKFSQKGNAAMHITLVHKKKDAIVIPADPNKTNYSADYFTVYGDDYQVESNTSENALEIPNLQSSKEETNDGNKKRYGPEDKNNLPSNPVLQDWIYCALCEYKTKVTPNMERHLSFHSNDIVAPSVAPVNPVPHLHSNELHFDKMTNLALSSNIDRQKKQTKYTNLHDVPVFVPESQRYVCGSSNCRYICLNEGMLEQHWNILHSGESEFYCKHCKTTVTSNDNSKTWFAGDHLNLHGKLLYKCERCTFIHFSENKIKSHCRAEHNDINFIMLRGDPEKKEDSKWLWECTVCMMKVSTKKEITMHCQEEHGTSHPFKCSHCVFSSYNESEMREHSENAHPGIPYGCISLYVNRFASNTSNANLDPVWWQQRKRPSPFTTNSTASKDEPKPKRHKSRDSEKSNSSPKKLTAVQPATKSGESSKGRIEEANKNKRSRPFDMNMDLGTTVGDKFRCPFCKDFTTENKQMFLLHLYRELEYRKWSCSICDYASYTSKNIETHMKATHQTQLECVVINENDDKEVWVQKCVSFQENQLSKIHTIDDSSGEDDRLVICEKETDKLPAVTYPCDICNKHCLTSAGLASHRRIHVQSMGSTDAHDLQPNENLVCVHCKATFKFNHEEAHRKKCHPGSLNLIIKTSHARYRCKNCKSGKLMHLNGFKNHSKFKHPDIPIAFDIFNAGVSESNDEPVRGNIFLFSCTYCSIKLKSYHGNMKHHKLRHADCVVRIMPLLKNKISDTGEMKKQLNLRPGSFACIFIGCTHMTDNYKTFLEHVRNHYCVIKCRCIASFENMELFNEHIKSTYCMSYIMNKEEEVHHRLAQIDEILEKSNKIKNFRCSADKDCRLLN